MRCDRGSVAVRRGQTGRADKAQSGPQRQRGDDDHDGGEKLAGVTYLWGEGRRAAPPGPARPTAAPLRTRRDAHRDRVKNFRFLVRVNVTFCV